MSSKDNSAEQVHQSSFNFEQSLIHKTHKESPDSNK